MPGMFWACNIRAASMLTHAVLEFSAKPATTPPAAPAMQGRRSFLSLQLLAGALAHSYTPPCSACSTAGWCPSHNVVQGPRSLPVRT